MKNILSSTYMDKNWANSPPIHRTKFEENRTCFEKEILFFTNRRKTAPKTELFGE